MNIPAGQGLLYLARSPLVNERLVAPTSGHFAAEHAGFWILDKQCFILLQSETHQNAHMGTALVRPYIEKTGRTVKGRDGLPNVAHSDSRQIHDDLSYNSGAN